MSSLRGANRYLRALAAVAPTALLLGGASLVATGALSLAGASSADAAGGPYAYVTNSSGNSVSVIDISTDTVVDTITGFHFPVRDTVSPDGSLLYVSEQGAGDVAIVDTSTDSIVAHVTTGGGPYDIAFTPDGATAYVVTSGGTITQIDTATSTATATIDVPGAFLQGAAVSPDGTRLYVADTTANEFVAIDIATRAIVSETSIPTGAGGIALSPDGSKAYLSSSGEPGFAIVDTTNDTVTQVGVGSTPEGIAITPDGSTVFAADQFLMGIDVLDTASATASTSTAGSWNQPDSVAVSADGAKVYFTNFMANDVNVLDASTDQPLATIGVGHGPCWVTIAPPPPAEVTLTLPTLGAGQDPRGATVQVSGANLEPGSALQVTEASGPAPSARPHVTGTLIGTLTADGSGAVAGDVTIPSTLGSGTYHLTAAGTGLNGLTKSASVTFTVPSSASPSTTAPPAQVVAQVPGATVPHTGEPFAGSGPYVLLTGGAGLLVAGTGLTLRRRSRATR